ncbi:MAG: protein-L-isoaspartate O-methyltransferase [Alphaproteobacteria bacterium]|nr:protein-L-isoaspartate O-methyltransferase [Alphaproteobacteria bacterium]
MNYLKARRNMIEKQLRANGVTNALILKAIEKIARENFLPQNIQFLAYSDDTLHLGNNRYAMNPLLTGRLLQIADIKPDDVVLDIGCNTGYMTALLSQLASTVVALENEIEFYDKALENLSKLDIDNAVVINSVLQNGLLEQAPYDVIIIEGMIPKTPEIIYKQLNENGRLISIIAENSLGHATIITRKAGKLEQKVLFETNTPVLIGFGN